MMSRELKQTIPAGHTYIKENVFRKNSLTGVSEGKELWAKNLNLSNHGEYTFFAGCGYQHMKYVEGMMDALKSAGRFGIKMGSVVGISKAFGKVGIDLTSMTAKMNASKEDPYTPVLVSAVSVLRKLGVDIGYMHEKEPCCGSPVYYAGFEKDYAEVARKNHRTFLEHGVKKIIGIVPGCTAALKNIYPKYVSDYELTVQHILEVILKRIEKKAVRLKVDKPMRVAYHDPCQLSRYLKLTEEPRKILRCIDGIELVESDPDEVGRWSTCCGGGGLEATHPELSDRMGKRRLDQLLKNDVTTIVTNCPACEMQLNKITRKQNQDLQIFDLVRLVDNSLPAEPVD